VKKTKAPPSLKSNAHRNFHGALRASSPIKDYNEKDIRPLPDYVAAAKPEEAPAAAREANGQWPKGTSGNPKGRPRKRERSYLPRQFVSDILALSEELITIKTEQGVEKMPVIQIALKQLIRKAMSGHGPSLRKLLDMHSNQSAMVSAVPRRRISRYFAFAQQPTEV
jgi:hypothetical protein